MVIKFGFQFIKEDMQKLLFPKKKRRKNKKEHASAF